MTEPSADRDPAAVQEFVERFAGVLAQQGWQRMAARVFVALLTTDSGRLTAAELATTLRVSPAAVSGAVRYLAQVQLITRERDPGSRRDVYRVPDRVWEDALAGRDRQLLQLEDGLRAGAAAVGADTPAGRRLVESAEFFEFLQKDLEALLSRWRAHRAKATRS